MNILITGGAGFIGTHIALRLKKLGYHAILVDFETQYTNFHRENFKVYDIDISKYENLNIIQENIDVIYHCAALSGVKTTNIKPEISVDWNVKGTLNICNFAKFKNCSKIIYTSTMAVYGEGDNLFESDSLNPISNYGVSKLASEYYIKMLSKHEIKYTIFRLFNTYGPGQDMQNINQGIVSIFLSQSIKGKHIKVTGSLERYRDLIYIDDVVDAMIMALSKEELENQIFNLCNSKKITIEHLINTILEIHEDDKENFSIENIGGHYGDPMGAIGNNFSLCSKGWTPKIKLKEGIKRFYKHSKNNPSRDTGWKKLEN